MFVVATCRLSSSTEMNVLSAELANKNFKPSNQAKRQKIVHHSSTSTVVPTLGMCSTLFIGNLDTNATEQDLIFTMQTYCDGFERLKFVPSSSGKTGKCWAKFSSPLAAANALHNLEGAYLSANPSAILQVELAKNDLDQPSHAKEAPGASGQTAFVQKIAAALQAPRQRQEHALHSTSGGFSNGSGTPIGASRHLGALPSRGHRNPPCDTMFIGGLTSLTTEAELQSSLILRSGFVRLKFVGEGTAKSMAFAQFDSIESCERAMEALQATSLPSAPSQALKCTFSKNPLDAPSSQRNGQY